MHPDLQPGLRHAQSIRVEPALTVPALAGVYGRQDDMPSVLATAYLVGFIEWTCLDALRPFLGENEATLGTQVDVSHVAATPVGMTLTAEVELVQIDGRRLRFRVRCRDELEQVGEGFHERTLIRRDRFEARLAAKRCETP